MKHAPSLSRRAFLGASAAAVGALASAAGGAGRAQRPKKLVMLAGHPSHGPMEHEFNAGVQLLKKCLGNVPGLEVLSYRNGWPDSPQVFDDASAVFCYADGGDGHPFLQDHRLQVIGELAKRGVGLMCAHYAVEVPKDRGGKQFKAWLGGYYEHLWSCNPMWTPEFKSLPQHEITRGVQPFAIRDEWYFNLRFRPDVLAILSARPSDATRDGPYVYPRGPYNHIQAAKGQTETMMWALERQDSGRSVGFTGGHYHRNWLNDNFRKVVLNALLWISKVEVPAEGVSSRVTEQEILQNLDSKRRRG